MKLQSCLGLTFFSNRLLAQASMPGQYWMNINTCSCKDVCLAGLELAVVNVIVASFQLLPLRCNCKLQVVFTS